MTREAQTLCFLAGANSIFYGEKLLTTGNPDVEADMQLLRELGMRALVPADEEADAGRRGAAPAARG
ncbi:MAG: hypothetical protein R3B99_21535 [Polyangiales bacterium]